MKVKDVQKQLREIGDKEIAEHSKSFFKTEKEEYGEGDRFLGIRVPEQRKVAKKFNKLSLSEVTKLLHSEYHEERLTALFILVHQFEKGDEEHKEAIYELYLENTSHINNWDLVDSSAYKILGPYLENRDRSVLYDLAKSGMVWERRIAMMSCLHFIKLEDFDDALAIAELLLDDEHDLIHKAVGWMLREIGDKDLPREEAFLKQHYREMPRTMLRYAIEKFPGKLRQKYLEREG